ncbi:unnamed protein product, partial [Prorocentrum cordatum]
ASHKNQNVEYWSVTLQNWLPAKIVDSRGTYFDRDLRFNALNYDVYVRSVGELLRGVAMETLRLPIVEGESVSVFSRKHGKSLIRKAIRLDADPMNGYDIELEDELADDGETYITSELQKDLENVGTKKEGEASGRSSVRPPKVLAPTSMPEQGVAECRLIKSMPAKQ